MFRFKRSKENKNTDSSIIVNLKKKRRKIIERLISVFSVTLFGIIFINSVWILKEIQYMNLEETTDVILGVNAVESSRRILWIKVFESEYLELDSEKSKLPYRLYPNQIEALNSYDFLDDIDSEHVGKEFQLTYYKGNNGNKNLVVYGIKLNGNTYLDTNKAIEQEKISMLKYKVGGLFLCIAGIIVLVLAFIKIKKCNQLINNAKINADGFENSAPSYTSEIDEDQDTDKTLPIVNKKKDAKKNIIGGCFCIVFAIVVFILCNLSMIQKSDLAEIVDTFSTMNSLSKEDHLVKYEFGATSSRSYQVWDISFRAFDKSFVEKNNWKWKFYLTVKKSDIEKSDTQHNALYGIRTDESEFLDPDKAIELNNENQRTGLWFAGIIGVLGLAVIFVGIIQIKKHARDSSNFKK